jgi:hypothetical protein
MVPNKANLNDPKERQAILDRAQKGDEKALPALREMLKEPYIAEACGNLAALAQHTLIAKFSGKNLAYQEGLRQKLVSLRAELGGPTPPPLERLLIERVVACWLHLYHLEQIYAQKESMTLDLAGHYQKCIDRAHKRYLTAIKTLAVVRKLALPVLQVNIAQKQVNVAGQSIIADESEAEA